MMKIQPAHLRPLIATALALLLVVVPAASASKSQKTVIEDPGRNLSLDPTVRSASIDEAAALGADVFKIAVTWRSYAPDSTDTVKPSIDLANPDAYPAGTWSTLDSAVQEAQAHGMKAWLMITAPAPRWAVRKENGRYIGNYDPSVTDYADFVTAIGRRYQDVGWFSFWNEPNLKRFLDRQTSRGIVHSAIHYREMYRAAYSAMRATGHGSDTLLFGELMPRSPARVDPNMSRPVTWLREFFCLDSRGRALKGRTAKRHECTTFKRISTTGLAYHPYRLSGGPLDRETVSKDQAPINYLSRITKVLDQAYRARHLSRRNLPIYNSEFGFQTDPPDVDAGTPIAKVPSFLNYSEFLTWKDRRVATYSQYELVDDSDMAGFQTGLRFLDGTIKPGVYAAFVTPMVAIKTRSRNRVTIWGKLRGKPVGSVPVQIQYLSGGQWQTLRTVNVSSTSAYLKTTVALSAAVSKTWRLEWSGGTSRSARPVREPMPRKR